MTEETAPETEVAPAVSEPVAEEVRPRRSWAGLAAAGLVLATAGGFALAWFDPLHWRGEDPVPGLQAQLSELAGQVDAARAAQAELADRVAALEAVPAPDGDLAARIAALEEAVAGLPVTMAGGADGTAPLAALQAEIDALKAALAGGPAVGSEAAVKAAVDAAMADWSASEATRVAARAARQAAVDTVLAAAQTGAPYEGALAALDGAGIAAVIRDHAATGLPTLPGLAESFPEAARSALEAALRETGGGGLAEGLWTFLRVQTGARSLEPREGSDPDAVLSRAEAALTGGDVAAALAELVALPAEGQAAIAEWVRQAQVYLAAQEALVGLSAITGQE